MRSRFLFLCIVALLAACSTRAVHADAPALEAMRVPIDYMKLTPVGNVTSVDRDASGLLLRCADRSEVRVTPIAPDIVRVRASLGKPLASIDHSWAVEKPPPVLSAEVREEATAIRISTSRLDVVIDRAPLRFHFYDKQGTLLDEDALPMRYDPLTGTIAAVRPLRFDQHYYGLGEKAFRLDKRHGAFTMWNYDTPGYVEGTDPLYQSIPFFIAIDYRAAQAGGGGLGVAHGIFFDNSWRGHFDFGNTQNEHAVFGAEGGEMNYYFIGGPSMREVISRYTDLTGRMPMLPRWALGHQQSRWSYYPEHAVESLVARYRAEDLPLDAVHLDIHYMDDYRVFTFNRNRFPEPAKFIQRMHDRGVKIVTIIDPGVKFQPQGGYSVYDDGVAKDVFLKYRDGRPMVGKVWPGEAVFVDYTMEKARQWWGEQHRPLVEAGVDGIWNDMNEPADFVDATGVRYMDVIFRDRGQNSPYLKNRNVFGYLMARATYEGLQRLRPDRRPYIITRAAYAGIQRYATMWTGDNTSSWDHLALSVQMLMGVGLSGEAFAGADVGGFFGKCSGELLTRWYEVAFLAPFCRNHKNIDGYDQEPWRFGQPYEDIIRRYLKLRYRFMPYLYTTMEESHRTGLPIMRPLLLTDQNDVNLVNVEDAYTVGNALLAAPVLGAARTARTVYLPKGTWFDWWTGRRYSGGHAVTVAAPLDRVPLFARGGTMVPMGPPMNFVDEKPESPITVEVFPDAHGRASGRLYEDDGVSLAYQRGVYRVLRMSLAGGRVNLRTPEGTYAVPRRDIVLRLHRPQGGVVQTTVTDDGKTRDVAMPSPHS